MTRIAPLAALFAAALAAAPAAQAQSYPARPLRLVIALAPGGGVDTSARLVAQKLTDAWGQQVVAENRPGAGGTIATELVAHTAPDGYTLLATSSAFSITPSLYKLPYDPVRDFTPVMRLVQSPHVLVAHPSVPVHNVRELVAFAKSHPNQLLWSSSGNGSPQHLAVELFKLMTGTKIVHVPYKGTAPSITDLIGGRVSLTAASVVSTMPHVTAGRLRGIAVLSSKRSQAAPQFPSVGESGVPGYEVDVWYGLFAPAGTPREIVARLYEEIARNLAQPAVKERMLALGLEPDALGPEPFAAYVRAETTKWGKVIRAAAVRIDD